MAEDNKQIVLTYHPEANTCKNNAVMNLLKHDASIFIEESIKVRLQNFKNVIFK